MAKRAADVMLDVYNGTAGTNPNLFRGTIPARIVAYQYRSLITPPFNQIGGYITYTSPIIRAGLISIDPPFFKVNPDYGSRVEEPISGFLATILYTERITPRVGSAYLRAYFM